MKKCVQCFNELEKYIEYGEAQQYVEYYTEEESKELTPNDVRLFIGSDKDRLIKAMGVRREKVYYCEHPDCPNYKLLQIGE